MMNKVDMVIGHVTRYEWPQIEPWVVSLEKSGFKGVKVVVAYEASKDLVDKLKARNISIFAFNQSPEGNLSYTGKPYSIVVDRFFHSWRFLKNIKDFDKQFGWVIMSDMKDVIFQDNPSTWLKNLNDTHYKIIAGSESLAYKHEAWGNENMKNSYSMLYDYMKDNIIYNAGTFASKAEIFPDFCLQVYLASLGNPVHNPDQAAFNILLTLEPWRNMVYKASQNDNWACQAGTIADPNKIQTFRPNLVDKEPTFKDGVVSSSNELPYIMVHQYDRVPEWKQHFEKVFRE